MLRFPKSLPVIALVSGFALGPCCSFAAALSEASNLSVEGSATIVQGSVAAIAGTADLVVESVEWLAGGVRCTLRGSEKVGRVVLMLPIQAVGAVSLAAGETVVIVARTTGWLITKAGEAVAFIPNQAGRALLHSEPVRR